MNHRILVIDDEKRWVEFVRNELREFEIVVVKDSRSALREIGTCDFDLVLVSTRHLDAIEKIKAKRFDQNVVAVTMQPNTTEQLQAYRAGAIRYFAKSFNRDDLLKKIREVIPAFAEVA